MLSKTTRVLHVVGGMNRGGVETWLLNVLRHIDRSQFHMDFLVHTNEKCAYDDEVIALGSRIIPCMTPAQPWLYAWRFRQALQAYGPYHVVHSHVYWFSGYVMWLAAHASVPTRLTHIYPVEDVQSENVLRRVYKRAMGRWISRYATHVLADSQAALNAFTHRCNYSKQTCAVVYPGVDLSCFDRLISRDQVRQHYGLPADIPVVLYVARFFPHKNHRAVFEIADRVNAQQTTAHFAIVGSHGPLMPRVAAAAAGREDVSVLTHVTDVSELMLASDLFVFPSLNEGFGVVAVEAQAAGLPVVATNLPTVIEVLAPSLRELSFAPDDVCQAARRVQALLADPVWRSQLGHESHQWAERFSIRASIAQLADVYSSYA